MRRLTTGQLHQEHGAVAIIVALLMTVLLAATAFTMDIGAIYSEQAQLQNGADAAALAVAQDCAAATCGDINATAGTYANRSANDGAANVTVDFPAAKSVHVRATSRDADSGAGSLALSFAPVLGIDSKTVSADATAAWGSPSSGPDILALAFAKCVFRLDGAIQVVALHGTGVGNCPDRSPSGQVLPGGFSWLADPTGTCSVKVTAGGQAVVSGDSGVSITAPCASVLTGLAGKIVLLPVYNDLGGTGTGAWYQIEGWAAFRVLGWNFTGNTSYRANYYSGATCTGDCKGLIGKFERFVSLDTRFASGGPDVGMGATIVRLTK